MKYVYCMQRFMEKVTKVNLVGFCVNPRYIIYILLIIFILVLTYICTRLASYMPANEYEPLI